MKTYKFVLLIVALLALPQCLLAQSSPRRSSPPQFPGYKYSVDEINRAFFDLCRGLSSRPVNGTGYTKLIEVSALTMYDDQVPSGAIVAELERMGVKPSEFSMLERPLEVTKWGEGRFEQNDVSLRFLRTEKGQDPQPSSPARATQILIETVFESPSGKKQPFSAPLADIENPAISSQTLMQLTTYQRLGAHRVWELMLELKPKTELEHLACAQIAAAVFYYTPNKWWEDGYSYPARDNDEATLNPWAFSHFAGHESVSKTQRKLLYCFLYRLPVPKHDLVRLPNGVFLTREQASRHRRKVEDPAYRGFLEAGHSEYFSEAAIRERAWKAGLEPKKPEGVPKPAIPTEDPARREGEPKEVSSSAEPAASGERSFLPWIIAALACVIALVSLVSLVTTRRKLREVAGERPPA